MKSCKKYLEESALLAKSNADYWASVHERNIQLFQESGPLNPTLERRYKAMNSSYTELKNAELKCKNLISQLEKQNADSANWVTKDVDLNPGSVGYKDDEFEPLSGEEEEEDDQQQPQPNNPQQPGNALPGNGQENLVNQAEEENEEGYEDDAQTRERIRQIEDQRQEEESDNEEIPEEVIIEEDEEVELHSLFDEAHARENLAPQAQEQEDNEEVEESEEDEDYEEIEEIKEMIKNGQKEPYREVEGKISPKYHLLHEVNTKELSILGDNDCPTEE